MNKKIYIVCVLSILYASIYRFRPYFTQRYTPLITEASITITKSNKPVYAEYDDGDKTYIIEDVDTIEIEDDEVDDTTHDTPLTVLREQVKAAEVELTGVQAFLT